MILRLRATLSRRRAEARIAPNAKLPRPLGKHILAFLRLTHGRSFHVPAALLTSVDALEDLVRHLPDGSSQRDVCALVWSAREQFPDAPLWLEVFNAVVTVLYANGFLDAERARELLDPFLDAGKGRTIRELLHEDE